MLARARSDRLRDAPCSRRTRTARRLRRAASPVRWALERLEQLGDVVIALSEPRAAKVLWAHAKGRDCHTSSALGRGLAEGLIAHAPERSSRTQRLGLETSRHIIIQCEGCSHIKMLFMTHLDVNRCALEAATRVRVPRGSSLNQ